MARVAAEPGALTTSRSLPTSADSSPVSSDATTDTPPKSARITGLDGFRAFLALLIVFSHLAHNLNSLKNFPDHLFAVGIRVPAFFALSGFVLMLAGVSLAEMRPKEPFASYVRRRFLRLVPPYYAILIITLISHWVISFVKPGFLTPEGIKAFGLQLLFLHSWFPDYAFLNIAALWMMGYEWQLSLLMPLFLWLVVRLGWIPVLALAVFLGLPWGEAIHRGFFYPSFTLAFLLGMAGAWIARGSSGLTASKSLLWNRVAIGTMIGSLLAIPVLSTVNSASFALQAMTGLCSAALCLHISLSPAGWLSRVLSWEPLRKIGTVSYSLFLIHGPVIQAALLLAGLLNLKGIWFDLCASLAIPALYFLVPRFYRVFEYPWIRRLDEEKQQRKTREDTEGKPRTGPANSQLPS